MAKRLAPRTRLDWRILLPDRMLSNLCKQQFVNRKKSLPALVAASRIGPRVSGSPPDHIAFVAVSRGCAPSNGYSRLGRKSYNDLGDLGDWGERELGWGWGWPIPPNSKRH